MTHFTLQEETLFKKPAYIVLDTRTIVKAMMAKMSAHQFNEEDNFAQILNEVLQIISYRKEAELSLQYESMHIIQEAMNMHSCELENVVEFSRFMVEFGMHLVQQLEEAGVYENGQMTYSYHQRLGNDIVLIQTFYAQPNDEHP